MQTATKRGSPPRARRGASPHFFGGSPAGAPARQAGGFGVWGRAGPAPPAPGPSRQVPHGGKGCAVRRWGKKPAGAAREKRPAGAARGKKGARCGAGGKGARCGAGEKAGRCARGKKGARCGAGEKAGRCARGKKGARCGAGKRAGAARAKRPAGAARVPAGPLSPGRKCRRGLPGRRRPPRGSRGGREKRERPANKSQVEISDFLGRQKGNTKSSR